jgi:hypothetical protein
MKIQVVSAILFVTMLSCTYNGIEDVSKNVVTNPVMREVHYNFTTGEKIAERNYTYDDRGNPIHEEFTSTVDPSSNSEILYEYNSGNFLVKKTEHYPKSWNGDARYITEFAYKEGQKTSESNYSDGQSNVMYKTLFFYTGVRIDSTQFVTYLVDNDQTLLNATLIYQYDDQKRLVEKAFTHGFGSTTYHYGPDQLLSTCDYMDVYGILRERCRDNEYNADGKVAKIFEKSDMVYPPTTHQLQEELFYKGDLLDERRVYTYPFYDKPDVPLITQIKYEY